MPAEPVDLGLEAEGTRPVCESPGDTSRSGVPPCLLAQPGPPWLCDLRTGASGLHLRIPGVPARGHEQASQVRSAAQHWAPRADRRGGPASVRSLPGQGGLPPPGSLRVRTSHGCWLRQSSWNRAHTPRKDQQAVWGPRVPRPGPGWRCSWHGDPCECLGCCLSWSGSRRHLQALFSHPRGTSSL